MRNLRRPLLLGLAVSTGTLAIVVGCGGGGDDAGDPATEGLDASSTQRADGSSTNEPEGGSSSKPDANTGPSGPFTISGSVSGLVLPAKDGGAPDGGDAGADAASDAGDGGAPRGLVLRDNGGDDLVIPGNGAFSFATKVAKGAPYAVTVASQPGPLPAQTCVVASGSGAATSDVSDVAVTCTTNTYTLGGAVIGLDNGESVVLQHEGGGDLTVQANVPFTFAQKLASGSPYAVTVKTPPAGKSCLVTNGAGTVTDANITNVSVDCSIRRSCAEHKAANAAAPDGIYPIDPDGNAGPNAPFSAYCDMTTSGGGWTLLVWTGDSSVGTFGVPYPGYAQCPALDCARGSGVPVASLKSLFSVSKELAKAQSTNALKATYGTLASYEYAGRYDYGTLDGLDVSYAGVVACTGFKTGTYHDVKGTAVSEGAAVYLSQAFAYSNHNDFSADTNGRSIWNVGVPSNYCNTTGNMPGTWMGNWATNGQYGPGVGASAGSHAVFVR